MADDKLTYSYVPDLIEYYLGERPLLSNVATYRLDDPDVRAECLGRLDKLVVKPVDGSGGAGIVIGPRATDSELAAVREQVLANPRGWIAQEMVLLSTAPAQVGDRLVPRHIDLRPFTVNDGERIQVLPGGLTRVALREGSLIVNSSQGGGSKDTWVLTSRPESGPEIDAPPAYPTYPAQAVRGTVPIGARATNNRSSREVGMLSRVAEALFWVGRYVERAEDTARLLDVHFHEILEEPSVAEAEACALLLSVMGVPDDIAAEHRTSQAVLDLLAYDLDTSVSIAGALVAARESARGAREALSEEIWECLNSTHNDLSARVASARDFGPAPFFWYVRERAATFAGHVEMSLSRDACHDVLVLGRSLERVDMTARLLAARVGAAGES
ncbi:MAG: hypothetical protein QOE61_5296 [Micromonosporaceae bacterium]|nr:hypothetical protein [Micromonosporaceae bacterium]